MNPNQNPSSSSNPDQNANPWDSQQRLWATILANNDPTNPYFANQNAVPPPPDMFYRMSYMPPPPQTETPETQPETQVMETQIPETQVDKPKAPRKRSHKKKVDVDVDVESYDRKKWDDDELMALAEAWIDSSEDSVLGDGKRAVFFWKEIREKFFTIMGRGRYRGDESVSKKWKEMVKKMNHFTSIHTRLWNNRSSGESDTEVLSAMFKQYNRLHGGDFNLHMFDIWKKCTSSPKWHAVPTSSPRPSKRSKTTSTSADQSPSQAASDARSQINLNDIQFDPEFQFDQPDELPRPIGRERAKAAARGGGSSSRTTSSMSSEVSERFDNLELVLKEYRHDKKSMHEERKAMHEEYKAMHEERIKAKAERQREKDFELLARDLSHLDAASRAFLEKQKARILAKYANEDYDAEI